MSRRVLVIILLLLVSAVVAFFFQDVIRSIIIIPIMYVLYLIRIIYEAFPQLIWWVLFILLLAVIATRSLSKRSENVRKVIMKQPQKLSRIQLWSQWINQNDQGDFYRWRLARKFGKLSQDILTQNERLTDEQFFQLLEKGKFDLPADFQSYIHIGLTTRSSWHMMKIEEVHRMQGKDPPTSLKTERVVEIIESLKERQS